MAGRVRLGKRQKDENGTLRLCTDVITSYSIHYTKLYELYLAGFSGGARMALAYAGRHPVQGTWVSGALADIDQLQQIHSPVVV